jgi:hypothetical protein
MILAPGDLLVVSEWKALASQGEKIGTNVQMKGNIKETWLRETLISQTRSLNIARTSN